MRKSILQVLTSLALLLPAVACADEYVLVMSKEGNLCQYMLGLYNDDLRKYGEVRYDEHDEFKWIEWEEKAFKLRPAGGLRQQASIENARVATFDINNDSKDEIIIYTQGLLSSNLTDYYDIFPAEILSMLDINAVVEGDLYFPKRLKILNSNDGVPVNVYDLSEEDIKKLPESRQESIAKAKERGDRDLFYVRGDNIKFLKHNNRTYIYFKEKKDHSYSGKSGQYSLIFELQKDSTLKNQCLYLIKKDKQSKGRK